MHVHQLPIHCTIYDALIDDDVDIRDKAASIASYLLSNGPQSATRNPTVSLSSAAALRSFQYYLLTVHAHSKQFVLQGLGRLIGTSLLNQMHLMNPYEQQSESSLYESLEPASNLLTAATPQDTSLFVVEKQNLFKDDAQECERWSAMLSMLPAPTISSIDIVPLQQWATDGLDHLLAMVEQQPTGPLAWASKPEVFAVGVQILEVTRLVINWCDKLGSRSEGQRLRSLIKLMQKPNFESRLHPLWLRKANAISSKTEGMSKANAAIQTA